MSSSTPQITRRAFVGGLTLGSVTLAGLAVRGAFPDQGAAAQESTPTDEFTVGGTLTFGYAQKTSYDHFMHMRDYAGGTSIYARTFANAKLITRNRDLTEWLPDVAERWEMAEDGKKITFYLRSGLTWHDGQPFTAADVDFTFHMIGIPGLGPINMGEQRFGEIMLGMREWIDGTADRIAGLTVVDDLTVSFDLLDSFDQEIPLIGFNYVCLSPKHILADYLNRETGKDILQSEWATTAKHVGLGPFRVVEYVPDQQVVYEPFENYYRGKPRLGKVVYVPFQDEQTLAASLESNEINVGKVPPTEYDRFKSLNAFDFLEAKPPSYIGVHINTQQPYLSDNRVRQALMHAIDRETLSKTLYAGASDIIDSPISVSQFGDSPNLKRYEYDPEKAKQLLTDAGWDSGHKLRWGVDAAPADESFYATVNGYWSKVGVEAEYQVTGEDLSPYQAPTWDFDLILNALAIGHPSQIAYYYDARKCTYACFRYTDPRYEELFDLSILKHPEEEAKAIIWELQEIIAEQVPALWLVRAPDIWGMDPKVHGLRPLYMAHILADWEMEKVWVG